ncbi:MAG: tail fiber protein [Corallincola sp.]|nr:tail fiber protein [Corallincola sp.]
MYWLDNNTGISTAPTIPPVISAAKRYFTNGGAGVQPSTPEDFWFHMVQEEMLGILTLAGITPDKSDLNQVAKAIQSIVFSAYPVGAPIPWPTAIPPTGFLAMIGQSFSTTTYPKLALAYPSGIIPDLRAMVIKGFDSGRGVDPSRSILSFQPGSLIYGDDDWAAGAMTLAGLNVGNRSWSSYGIANPSNYPQARAGSLTTTTVSGGVAVNFNAAGIAQVDNVAFYYIVRAV